VTILPIAITGTPVLHTPAALVTDLDDDIQALIDDMVDTMHAAPGVGLAAPQVGVGLRIFVWHYDDGETLWRGEVINPTLDLSGGRENLLRGEPDDEGCLSIPGERAPLARYRRATLSGTDRYGSPLRVEAEGWLARIFQHEFDHLNGILYRDRVARINQRDLDTAIAERGWGSGPAEWTPSPHFRESDWLPEEDLGHPDE
jgi:peptide deformylase